MAFYRGMDGAVQIGGVAVAQVESWDMTTSIVVLDTTSMGDAWKSVVGGQASWSGKAAAKIDIAVAAQSTLASSLITATPAGTVVALKLMVAGTTKFFNGNALLKNIQVQSQLGQIVKISFDFEGSGALAYTWT